jgi:hypothetical protein
MAVAPANVARPAVSALGLGCVVQQRADPLVLRAAVLEHRSGDAQQMSDVRAIA